VPLSKTGAQLLFEVFSQRYERSSTLVTSNLPFREWTEVPQLGTADRRPAGPAHPPRSHPGDERRQLPAQAEQAQTEIPTRHHVSPLPSPPAKRRGRMPSSATLQTPSSPQIPLSLPTSLAYFYSETLADFCFELDSATPAGHNECGFCISPVGRARIENRKNQLCPPRGWSCHLTRLCRLNDRTTLAAAWDRNAGESAFPV
jgi:hypothetical protein